MTLKQYLENKNSTSAFSASMSDVGGNIIFSNSGTRGSVKEFTLGLDSFISIIKDIKTNLNLFRVQKKYEEKKWRELGSEFYSDGPANAMSTAQTKPLFTTISKIICWANSPNLENIDTHRFMEIEDGALQNTIDHLEILAQLYLPIQDSAISISQQENFVIKDKLIREFAKYLFTYFFGNDWHEILDSTKQNPSVINGVNFVSHDFDIFKRLIGEFSAQQTKESLTTSKTIRYFEEPILKENNKIYYFTTQWNGEGDYSLSFSNLKIFIEKRYPEYRVIRKDEIYFLVKLETISYVKFIIDDFLTTLEFSGLSYSNELITRFIASLLTKPFVILTGLSGSGKTKLAQAFVTWISASPSQYKIIPVGADWTNREPLLGYPNGLKDEQYVAPDSGSLQLLIEASKKENENKPYFLILDEMNLSHVERYFADFLSVMESQDKIRLYSGKNRFITEQGKDDVPQEIGWPRNLFIIGTVNIDETTYMFSPKVLDRANVIEFRISKKEMVDFLASPSRPDLSKLLVDGVDKNGGLGQEMASDFMKLAEDKSISADAALKEIMADFFTELQKAGAEFGYRSASEILLLIKNLDCVAGESKMAMDEKLDIAIMQKLLPKLHGSRNKLVKVLETLAGLCLKNEEKRKSVKTEYLEPFSKNEKTEADFEGDEIRYKISFLKLCRMYKAAMENGYASYAEA